MPRSALVYEFMMDILLDLYTVDNRIVYAESQLLYVSKLTSILLNYPERPCVVFEDFTENLTGNIARKIFN